LGQEQQAAGPTARYIAAQFTARMRRTLLSLDHLYRRVFAPILMPNFPLTRGPAKCPASLSVCRHVDTPCAKSESIEEIDHVLLLMGA
jgi:hypothetical protein